MGARVSDCSRLNDKRRDYSRQERIIRNCGRPYFKRYTDDATDLCDVLSSFDSRSKMKLNDLCRALNLPGKPDGIDGSQVEQLFAEGRIAEVADYCECDVVSTYRLWLLHELFKGAISAEEHERSELALSDLSLPAFKISHIGLGFELGPPSRR
jgi:predicted PolB exonuclease-like 3'-5' exonuclease